MRPQSLNSLFAPIDTLDGIGQKTTGRIEHLLADSSKRVTKVLDLLFHLPASIVDRQNTPSIKGAKNDEIVTLEVRIDSHHPPSMNSRAPYKVLVHDESGELTLVFFRPKGDWIKKILPEGEVRYVSGRIELYNNIPQMAHPDFILTADEFVKQPLLEPVYSLTDGVNQKLLRKGISSALERLTDLPEWQDPTLLSRENFSTFKESLQKVHQPTEIGDIEPNSPYRRRIAYDEYLASQLGLALVRHNIRGQSGNPNKSSGKLAGKIVSKLPFKLTDCQSKAIQEIAQDLESKCNMHRLLQGDVGSGKTIVALLSMIHIVESGAQAALMAPTEILARQHFETISKLCEAIDVRIAILTGRDNSKHRQSTETALASGELDIIVGTHALFQSGIEFQHLALAVIDEQHRFGVHQRLSLSNKGKNTNILVMTATPIPRSLVLTYFGDMDVSKIEEKPKNRTKVKTATVPINRLDDVIARLKSAVVSGKKVYWICPLIKENQDLDATAAENRYKSLKDAIGDKVALLHGQMSGEEKDLTMESFRSGDCRLLVSTTVVEVGVDVPDATIMVIEHAERFGLAQLHQLRGRIGRGSEESNCLLLYKSPLTEAGKNRLDVIRKTDDGFLIAEEDLKLRGEGEILGTRQSGTPGFRTVDRTIHNDLLEIARDDAKLILKNDPQLKSERGEALKLLLYLFERQDVISLLQSG